MIKQILRWERESTFDRVSNVCVSIVIVLGVIGLTMDFFGINPLAVMVVLIVFAPLWVFLMWRALKRAQVKANLLRELIK
jgi:uncharacterized membrane protein YgaE (UPF0421/DUF939 family)